jgi:hypothetical protein
LVLIDYLVDLITILEKDGDVQAILLQCLAKKRRTELQKHVNDTSVGQWAADYARVECVLSATLLQLSEKAQGSAYIIEAIQCLDKALLAIGPLQFLVDRISALEERYGDVIKTYNSKWKVAELQLKHPEAVPWKYLPVTLLDNPSLETFICSNNRPCRITGIIDDWPAIESWKDFRFFAQKYGHRIVPVEFGASYVHDSWRQELIPLGTFLERIDCENEIMYLAQHDLFSQIPGLESFISTPEYALMTGGDVDKNIWFGQSGTTTPLHFDPYENIFCQVVGFKRFFLIDPKFSALIPLDDKSYGHNPNTSSMGIHVMNPETLPFPVHKVTLGPGEVLYIPPGWWHLVSGLTNSISVSFWF